jgi:succinyl-CoA:acetate CoA-transferase
LLVTENGLADLRGLSPKERAKLVTEKCAGPEYSPVLLDYLSRSEQLSYGKHTPQLLTQSLSCHNRYLRTRNLRPWED